MCKSSKPSFDVHSSLQYNGESTLSYVQQEELLDLNYGTSSFENLRELQKYSEKLTYESTCCRLWAEGIQTYIKDEQEKVQKWIAGMTEDLLG